MTRAIARIWALAGAVLLIAAVCVGQQAPKKLTNHDITQMVSLGLSEDVIVDKIRAADATDFDTSIEELKGRK